MPTYSALSLTPGMTSPPFRSIAISYFPLRVSEVGETPGNQLFAGLPNVAPAVPGAGSPSRTSSVLPEPGV